MIEELKTWKEVSWKRYKVFNFNIAEDYEILLRTIKEEKPDAVVHFAEQRAAPYSMKSSRHKIYTVKNNLNATNNLCCSIVESGLDIHLVHLGTMGFTLIWNIRNEDSRRLFKCAEQGR